MSEGIVLLDKPLGFSSNAALQRVRRLLQAKKAGHVGSLDPLATGMLPICLGEATKVAGDIQAGRKRYRFTVTLGARTATGDTEGAVVEELPVPLLETAQIEAALERFRGRQLQIPPMYSALKRDGQPLYRLARAGLTVERAAREIEVAELLLCGVEPGTLILEALCSKGTYVRSLAEDIARALGTCGHVASLRRLYVEPFDAEPMETLESLAACCAAGRSPSILPVDYALRHLPAASLDGAEALRLQQGQAVSAHPASLMGRVRIYDESGRFLGMGEADGAGQLRPRRLLVRPSC